MGLSIDMEKVIDGLGLIREFLGQGLPGQRQVFETYINVLNDAENMLKEQAEQIKQLEHDLAVTENNINYYVNGND